MRMRFKSIFLREKKKMIFININWSWSLIVSSIIFGVGLAMDAFSVSLASGFEDPLMKKRKMFAITGTFAFFQALMPMLGWLLVHTVYEFFSGFKYAIPYIALVLLTYLGIKMIIEYHKSKNNNNDEVDENCQEKNRSFFLCLLLQGIATSIDALSVGLETYEYQFLEALVASIIIAIMTFIICLLGIFLGRKFGKAIGKSATLVGGIILITIGVLIFTKGMLSLYAPDIMDKIPFLK